MFTPVGYLLLVLVLANSGSRCPTITRRPIASTTENDQTLLCEWMMGAMGGSINRVASHSLGEMPGIILSNSPLNQIPNTFRTAHPKINTLWRRPEPL